MHRIKNHLEYSVNFDEVFSLVIKVTNNPSISPRHSHDRGLGASLAKYKNGFPPHNDLGEKIYME